MKRPTARAALAEKPSDIAQETLDRDETEFVLAVMRLATGAHPFAAIRLLTLAVVQLRRDAHIEVVGVPLEVMTISGVDLPNPETRKPWVEPTVTELPLPRAPANIKPATLTIVGADPSPPAPSVVPTAAEIHGAVAWLRQRASLQPVRSGEFEVVAKIMEGVAAAIGCGAPPAFSIDVMKLLNDLERQARWIGGEEYSEDTGWRCGAKGLDGKGYAADMRAASAEIQRQAAEISELQGLLEEATPVARFVSELATLTDTEVDFMGVGEIRATARGKIGEPYGFTLPRLYGEEDRRRAVAAMLGRDTTCQGTVEYHAGAIVDIVAEALGLQRAC